MDHLKRNPDVTEIMIIAHADEAGNLYDARGSVIPRGFLFNLPPALRKVILFSCHSEAVLEPDQGILPLRVREFVSKDGESHIQTIGTVGGNP